MKKIKKPFKLILFLPIGIFMSYVATSIPNFIEKVYSNGFYKVIVQVLSISTSFFPLSVAEIIFVILIFFFLWKFISMIMKIIHQKHFEKYMLLHFILNTMIFVSITYFLFIVLWGLNYYRIPFYKIANLDVQPASTIELELLCKDLINNANNLRCIVKENKNGVMSLSSGYTNTFSTASKGYERASNIYPELSGKYGNPKGIIFSKIMSFAGIGGIYSPFTGEANVNILMPDPTLPSTACHEMAHQRGFSREDEANYIAYLTCSMHPDVDFQYSGTLLALIHSMNALFRYDEEKYILLHKKYSNGLLRDLAAIKSFWQKYEGPIERVSTKLNNAYLKSNRQKDGVQSYGRMVDLLIAQHRLKMSK